MNVFFGGQLAALRVNAAPIGIYQKTRALINIKEDHINRGICLSRKNYLHIGQI